MTASKATPHLPGYLATSLISAAQGEHAPCLQDYPPMTKYKPIVNLLNALGLACHPVLMAIEMQSLDDHVPLSQAPLRLWAELGLPC